MNMKFWNYGNGRTSDLGHQTSVVRSRESEVLRLVILAVSMLSTIAYSANAAELQALINLKQSEKGMKPYSWPKPTEAAPALVPLPREMSLTGGTCADAAKPKVERVAGIPPEGYELSVRPDGATIRASDDAGEFYAMQTLAQLRSPGTATIPCCEIKDSPRYPWRGVLLDESRHFFGKETVKAIIDEMARFKFNRFHWHLTDDQGWRIEVPGYPELVEYGAVRKSSPKRPDHGGPCGKEKQIQDGKKYGPFFYTEADLKEIIAYAKERHVEIVPEIDMPGHFKAALAAYPDYACFPKNLASRQPRTTWGIEFDVLCAGNDEAIKFAEGVLDYVCKVFPFGVVHIGGDECPKRRWNECPKCLSRIKTEGLKDAYELQGWFTRHMAEFLAGRGKRTIGWAEYLGAGVPADALGMQWRGESVAKKVDSAARNGHEMVVCPSPFCYLNHAPGLKDDPYPYGGGGRTIEKCYAFDPSEGVSAEAAKRVIGGQGCQWTEYSWDRKDLEWKYWPRLMALSEAFWLGEAKPGFEDFKRRAAIRRDEMVARGVNAAPLP